MPPLPLCLTNSFASRRPSFSDSSPKNCTFHFRHWLLYSSYSPKVSTNGGKGACADAFLPCRGWCAHPGGGDTCPPLLSVAPCKPTTPHCYPSPGASKLCPPGAAWTRTDPSRPQYGGTLGPGLHPAPTPGSALRHKGLILQDPWDPQIPGYRENGISDPPQQSHGSHPTERASVAMATRPRLRLFGHIYACARVEYPRTRRLQSHSTQDAPRCLRHDVTTDVTTRD